MELALQLPDGEELVESIPDANFFDGDERLGIDLHDVVNDWTRVKGDLGLNLEWGHRRGDGAIGHHRVSALQTECFVDRDRAEQASPGRQDDGNINLGDRLTDRVRKLPLMIDEGPVNIEGHHARSKCHASQLATMR